MEEEEGGDGKSSRMLTYDLSWHQDIIPEFKLCQEKWVKWTGMGRIDPLATKYIFPCKLLELILIIAESKSPDVVCAI